jgi:serine/threonine protein kinase
LDNTLNDLLRKIFVYSPLKRITASEALRHEYFNDVDKRNQKSSIFKYSNRSLMLATPSDRKNE